MITYQTYNVKQERFNLLYKYFVFVCFNILIYLRLVSNKINVY